MARRHGKLAGVGVVNRTVYVPAGQSGALVKLPRQIISTSTLVLLAGTNGNLTLPAGADTIVFAAGLADGESQTADVREVAADGRALENRWTITGRAVHERLIAPISAQIGESAPNGTLVAQLSLLNAVGPVTFAMIDEGQQNAFSLSPSGAVTKTGNLNFAITQIEGLVFSATDSLGTVMISFPVTILDDANYPPVGQAPQPVSAPVVTGTPIQHRKLVGTPAVFTGADNGVSNQWLVDGQPVAGATGLEFQPRTQDIGKTVTFRSTGINNVGSTVSTSIATAVVAPLVFDKPGFTKTSAAGANPLTADVELDRDTYKVGDGLVLQLDDNSGFTSPLEETVALTAAHLHADPAQRADVVFQALAGPMPIGTHHARVLPRLLDVTGPASDAISDTFAAAPAPSGTALSATDKTPGITLSANDAKAASNTNTAAESIVRATKGHRRTDNVRFSFTVDALKTGNDSVFIVGLMPLGVSLPSNPGYNSGYLAYSLATGSWGHEINTQGQSAYEPNPFPVVGTVIAFEINAGSLIMSMNGTVLGTRLLPDDDRLWFPSLGLNQLNAGTADFTQWPGV